jgi:hypothetical protein
MHSNTLTLTANGVVEADGSVAKAEFYIDARGNGILEDGGRADMVWVNDGFGNFAGPPSRGGLEHCRRHRGH